MSVLARSYIRDLTVCPNGERLTPAEKLVAWVIAVDLMDRTRMIMYSSVAELAEYPILSERSCLRHLAELERKGVLLRLLPRNDGLQDMVIYCFPALDEKLPGGQS